MFKVLEKIDFKFRNFNFLLIIINCLINVLFGFGLEKGRGVGVGVNLAYRNNYNLFRACVFSHSLSSFTDCVFG